MKHIARRIELSKAISDWEKKANALTDALRKYAKEYGEYERRTEGAISGVHGQGCDAGEDETMRVDRTEEALRRLRGWHESLAREKAELKERAIAEAEQSFKHLKLVLR